MPWIEVLTRLLSEKVTVINEFDIDTEKLKKKSTKERAEQPEGLMDYKIFFSFLQNVL